MKKLISIIKQYLPVTRKQYSIDMNKMLDVIQGLIGNETQHSQMEMSLMQSMNELKKGSVVGKKSNSNDPAFN